MPEEDVKDFEQDYGRPRTAILLSVFAPLRRDGFSHNRRKDAKTRKPCLVLLFAITLTYWSS
jgi:hypothetical protein